MADEQMAIDIPETLPILTLRNAVLFPGAIFPIDVGRKKSVRLIEDLVSRSETILGVVTQKDPKTEDPQEEDLYTIGTVARILKVIRLARDSFSVIIQGVSRMEVIGFVSREPYITARIRPITEPEEMPEDEEERLALEALMTELRETAKKVISLIPDIPKEAASIIDTLMLPGQLADLIASNLDIPVDEKINILATSDVKERLKTVLVYLNRQLRVLKVREEINEQVQKELHKSQREYILRQHLKAIREELGENDDPESEVEELEEKIRDSGMTEEAEAMARKQLARLRMMPPASSEYSVTHTYIDWLVSLPWKDETEDHLDVSEARRILDEDHYDLEKVKKRIIEYLAVRKLNPDKKGPILCLAGPPGVGKTSLGRSIARALGRKFWRISLGGVRDEAEIRGHRRTYVGALPGRIIQGLRKVGVKNPVFMLDEIDKLGHDFRGDPASALLEVLDPEQNVSFSDHYLEVHFDLSKVMFIATANTLHTIPAALLDRMEVLELPGYTREEKLEIAKRYLVPRQKKEHGLDKWDVHFSNEGICKIIDHYTREAGVRNLERSIEAVMRAVAVEVAEGGVPEGEVISVDAARVRDILGPERYLRERELDEPQVGVATGLAWTPAGGDIIFVEARLMPGHGQTVLTGQLGDVMKESAQAALSYIRSRSDEFGVEQDFMKKYDIHVHVPAGAVPKDGPSAGVTMFTTLLSLLSGRRVRSDIAMTGEITLRGKVLPVGGIKEKSLAALRAGIDTVILPEDNAKDIEEIPETARNRLKFIFVRHLDELPDLVLLEPEKDKDSGA